VAAVATSWGREISRHWRRGLGREPPDDAEEPDDAEDPDEEEDPELPDDRAPDDLEADPEDDPDGARADGPEDLPDDEPPRTDGEYVYGDPDPMFRLGRVGEVRGTMTGRDEPDERLERPPPTRGVTGCRTRGEDEFRVLGRNDEPRATGREEELRVLGRFRPLDETPPALAGSRPWVRVLGSTRVRVPPPEEPNPGR
jgi:hypothetical protein